MKLELVPVPVTDIDRAIGFYVGQLGFHLDHDTQPGNGVRVCQLTPHGSGCSIVLTTGLPDLSAMMPGTIKGLHLVVKDIRQVRDALISRGVVMGDLIEYPNSVKFSSFSDPDNNTWTLQEIPANR
jgi:catechol 2,3-dioxygenase-like lactoylglutathione lyase family enzyme